MTKPNSKLCNFRLAPATVERLDALASQYAISATKVVELAIEQLYQSTQGDNFVRHMNQMAYVTVPGDYPEGVRMEARSKDPKRLVPGDGIEVRPDPRPEPDGIQGTISVDPAKKSATVNVMPQASPNEKPKDMTWAKWDMLQRKNDPPPVPAWRQDVKSFEKREKK